MKKFLILLLIVLLTFGIILFFSYNDKISASNNTNVILSNKVNTLSTQMNELLFEIDNLQKQFNLKKNEITTLNNKLLEKEKQLNNANNLIADLNSRLDEITQYAEEQHSLVVQYLELIDDLNNQISFLNDQIADITNEKQQEIDRLTQELNTVTQNLLIIQTNLENAENEISRLIDEKNNLTSEVNNLNNIISTLQQEILIKVEDIERISQENEELKTQINELEKRKNDLEDTLSLQNEEMVYLCTMIEDLRIEVKDLNNQINDLTIIIDDLNKQLQDKTNYISDLEKQLQDKSPRQEFLEIKAEAVGLLDIPVTPLNEFVFNGNVVVGYNGNRNYVRLPEYYSLGEVVTTSINFDNYNDLDEYICDNEFYFIYPVSIKYSNFNGDIDTFTMYSYDDFFDCDIALQESDNIVLEYGVQQYIEGFDYKITSFNPIKYTRNIEFLFIPDTVTKITFFGTSINYIRLPSNLSVLDCPIKSANYIKIPASIENIALTFVGFSNLKYIEVDTNNLYYTSQDENGNELNCIMNKERTKLIYATSNFDFSTLPITVTEICDYALASYDLSECNLPSFINKCGRYIIKDSKIEVLSLSSSTLILDSHSFHHCKTLKTLKLLSNTMVDYNLFENLAGYNYSASILLDELETIFVPNSLLDVYTSSSGWSKYSSKFQGF